MATEFACVQPDPGTTPGLPATNATSGCCARTTCPGPGFTVAVTCFVSALPDASVPLATPAASVGTGGWSSTFDLPDADSEITAPETGLPRASRTVTVSADVWRASAARVVGLAVTVDAAGSGGPATK